MNIASHDSLKTVLGVMSLFIVIGGILWGFSGDTKQLETHSTDFEQEFRRSFKRMETETGIEKERLRSLEVGIEGRLASLEAKMEHLQASLQQCIEVLNEIRGKV